MIAEIMLGPSELGMLAPSLRAALFSVVTNNLHYIGAQLAQMQATMFMGACISITAFPVLARIIHERGLSKTPLGRYRSLRVQSVWVILAVLLASLGDGPHVALAAIVGTATFAALMFKFGPRILRPLGSAVERNGSVGQSLLAIVFVACLYSAIMT
jgi:Kef-type K+ transport system membrane component KefB